MIYNWVKLRGKPKFIVIRNMLFKVLMNGPVIGQRMVGRIQRETVANKDLIQETVALKIVLTKLIKIKIGEIWNLFMLKVMLVILVMKLLIDWQIKELINMARGRHFLVIKCLYMHICTETKIDKIFIYYSTTNIIIFVYLFYLCYLKTKTPHYFNSYTCFFSCDFLTFINLAIVCNTLRCLKWIEHQIQQAIMARND